MKYSIFSVSDYYPDLQPNIHSFIEDQVSLAQIAEDLGFYGYFNAEHHFHEYGLIPDPAVLLSAVAMKTSNIMIGPAVSILTFLHPLRAAEQWAMVDQLSKGRLVLGVGSGYLMHEFEGFSMSPAQKRDRFDETLEIMEKALTGKKFSHKGKYYDFKNVRLNITPYNGREVDTAVAILTEIASYYVGKRGYNIMTIPYATVQNINDLTPIYGNYRRGIAESGKDTPGEVIAAVHTHAGDQSSADSALAKEHFEKYVYTRLYAQHASYDECLNRGVIASGNPDEVATSLQNVINTGADHLLLLTNFGGMPMSEVEKSLKRIAKDVLPQLEGASS